MYRLNFLQYLGLGSLGLLLWLAPRAYKMPDAIQGGALLLSGTCFGAIALSANATVRAIEQQTRISQEQAVQIKAEAILDKKIQAYEYTCRLEAAQQALRKHYNLPDPVPPATQSVAPQQHPSLPPQLAATQSNYYPATPPVAGQQQAQQHPQLAATVAVNETPFIVQLARDRNSKLIVGAPGCGKTVTAKAWIAYVLQLFPDATILINYRKKASFCGLETVSGCTTQSRQGNLRGLFAQMKLAHAVLQERSDMNPSERLQQPPFILYIADYAATWNNIANIMSDRKNPLYNDAKLFQEQLGELITVGRECNVQVVVDTQSFNLEALGNLDANERGCLTTLALGFESLDANGQKSGNYEVLQILLRNAFIVANNGDRETLNAATPKMREISRQQKRPLAYSGLGESGLFLLPDYRAFEDYLLPQETLQRLEANVARYHSVHPELTEEFAKERFSLGQSPSSPPDAIALLQKCWSLPESTEAENLQGSETVLQTPVNYLTQLESVFYEFGENLQIFHLPEEKLNRTLFALWKAYLGAGRGKAKFIEEGLGCKGRYYDYGTAWWLMLVAKFEPWTEEKYPPNWSDISQFTRKLTGDRCCYPGCNGVATETHHAYYVQPGEFTLPGRVGFPLCDVHHSDRSHPDCAHHSANWIKGETEIQNHSTPEYYALLLQGWSEKVLPKYRG